MEQLQLSQYTERGAQLLADVKQAFQQAQLDTAVLPATFTDTDDAIKLVFVGQYSAGKSSIIKMLTGEDVKIGAKITTQESKPYPWRGLEIIDTPGIQTGLREDHDKITYNEINHAALLIFVLTNEGFDNTLGNHFRKLAIEDKRAKNMVLVVNKMDRTALGNVPEQQQIIADDMEKVTTPYKPKDLYVSFIDTQAYFDSQDETDPEFKTDLLAQSGRDVFIANLNDFVKTRGVLAKIQRPLYTIENALKQAIAEQHSIGGSMSLDGVEELINRQINSISSGKHRAQRLIDGIIRNYATQISSAGRDVTMLLDGQVTEKELKDALQQKEKAVADLAARCQQEIVDVVNAAVNEMQLDVQKQFDSAFTQNVQLQMAREGLVPVDNEGGQTSSDGSTNFVKDLSQTLGQMTTKGGQTLSVMQFGGAKMANFSGTFAHNAIKEIGSFVGFKFAPWQAVQFTKYLSGLGTILAVVGAVSAVWSILTAGDKQKEREQQIRQAKRDIQSKFDECANSLKIQLADGVNQYMRESFDKTLEERQEKIREIQQKRIVAKQNSQAFEALLTKEQALMQDIQRNL